MLLVKDIGTRPLNAAVPQECAGAGRSLYELSRRAGCVGQGARVLKPEPGHEITHLQYKVSGIDQPWHGTRHSMRFTRSVCMHGQHDHPSHRDSLESVAVLSFVLRNP